VHIIFLQTIILLQGNCSQLIGKNVHQCGIYQMLRYLPSWLCVFA
jgi:hypothetical protein